MARLFNSISIPRKRRNKFDLSFESRLTTDFGRLTPILCEPVLPNDIFKISTNVRVQFAPMKFPVMQKFTAYIHYFFVPNRLLWDKWEDFITGGEDGLQEPDYPFLNINHDFKVFCESSTAPDPCVPRSLFDYLGFPALGAGYLIDTNAEPEIDALPFKAYQLVYNEWYRDQNLADEVDILKSASGSQLTAGPQKQFDLMTLRLRAWKKDYFTSALPDPQRGPDVTLPILGEIDITGTGKAPVVVDTMSVGTGEGTDQSLMKGQSSGGSNIFAAAKDTTGMVSGEDLLLLGTAERSGIASGLKGKVVDSEGDPTLRSATINEVRRAFAIQRWYELAARAGSRYVEQILAHFGIRSSDARLQRPEYLGGSVVPVFVGDVIQTSETDGTPLGTPGGIAQAAGRVKQIRRVFEEHGWILGILSIIPQAAYYQGIPRKFLKRDKFDFAWPLLANLGEQEIQNQELFFDWDEPADNAGGFGYAPRYSEYKFGAGQVHGDFRTSLADFHDARQFSSAPALNSEFVQVKANGVTPHSGLNRIFAVTSGMVDHLWVYLYNDIKVRRVLPKYGTPI